MLYIKHIINIILKAWTSLRLFTSLYHAHMLKRRKRARGVSTPEGASTLQDALTRKGAFTIEGVHALKDAASGKDASQERRSEVPRHFKTLLWVRTLWRSKALDAQDASLAKDTSEKGHSNVCLCSKTCFSWRRSTALQHTQTFRRLKTHISTCGPAFRWICTVRSKEKQVPEKWCSASVKRESSTAWPMIHVRNLLGWLRLGWLKICLITSK